MLPFFFGNNVSFGYNDNSDLASIYSGGTALWKCQAINALGQITSYAQDSYTTQIDYDPYEILEQIRTISVFDMEYQFDDPGLSLYP